MVDNKVKTKTAMLQELESIKHLLLEDDDIPILQEVIDGQLATRNDDNQMPLEQQELDELQHQFQTLSQTFNASTPAAAPTIAPSLFDTYPEASAFNQLETDDEPFATVAEPIANSREPITSSHEPSANSSEYLTGNPESVANSREPITSSLEPLINSHELPLKSPELAAKSREPLITNAASTPPVQQALPMEAAATDIHSESDSSHPIATTTNHNTTSGTEQITEMSADEPLAASSPTKTQPARPTLAKATGENPFLPQHIRARLHGNNPPPLFDFMLNNSNNPAPATISSAGSSDKKSLHQDLIKDVVDALMPQLEDELRQRLKELTQEELERLRDQPQA